MSYIQKSKESGWLFGGRDSKKIEELEVMRKELEEKILENGESLLLDFQFFLI